MRVAAAHRADGGAGQPRPGPRGPEAGASSRARVRQAAGLQSPAAGRRRHPPVPLPRTRPRPASIYKAILEEHSRAGASQPAPGGRALGRPVRRVGRPGAGRRDLPHGRHAGRREVHRRHRRARRSRTAPCCASPSRSCAAATSGRRANSWSGSSWTIPSRRLEGLYCFLRARPTATPAVTRRRSATTRCLQAAAVGRLPRPGPVRHRRQLPPHGRAGKVAGMASERSRRRSRPTTTSRSWRSYQTLVEARLARAQGARRRRPAVQRLRTGFEPGEQVPPVRPASCRTVPGAGHRRAARRPFDQIATVPHAFGVLRVHRPLKNLTPNGTYWVEFWYRDTVPVHAAGAPAIATAIYF